MERERVEANTILRCLIGSGIHGMAVEGYDDRDEQGICIEDPEFIIGHRTFEQFHWRSQPEGVRSGPGDLDLDIYGLKKWMKLATQGNPSILLLLFVPDEHCMVLTDVGRDLRDNLTPHIVSGHALPRFLGYLQAQRDQMLGIRGGAHTNRPELVDKYGYDVKFAAHMCRLGLQGYELLTTGRMTLPIPEPHGSWLRDMRVGKVSKDDALAFAAEYEAKLLEMKEGTVKSVLRESPDYETLDKWMFHTYLEKWVMEREYI